MREASTFRTILIAFIMAILVVALILFVTINTPVTSGIVVETIIGDDVPEFFSNTTLDEEDDVELSEEFVVSFVSFSVK